jgi:hypothetical protein
MIEPQNRNACKRVLSGVLNSDCDLSIRTKNFYKMQG